MWKKVNGCGCENNSKPDNIIIRDSPKINNKIYDGIINLPYNNRICELKDKAICNYTDILSQLECGQLPDLEFLLEEISLIDIEEEELSLGRIELQYSEYLNYNPFSEKSTRYPYINKETGTWFVGELDTGVSATGTPGITPSINPDNGHWMIGDIDTGYNVTGNFVIESISKEAIDQLIND